MSPEALFCVYGREPFPSEVDFVDLRRPSTMNIHVDRRGYGPVAYFFRRKITIVQDVYRAKGIIAAGADRVVSFEFMDAHVCRNIEDAASAGDQESGIQICKGRVVTIALVIHVTVFFFYGEIQVIEEFEYGSLIVQVEIPVLPVGQKILNDVVVKRPSGTANIRAVDRKQFTGFDVRAGHAAIAEVDLGVRADNQALSFQYRGNDRHSSLLVSFQAVIRVLRRLTQGSLSNTRAAPYFQPDKESPRSAFFELRVNPIPIQME